MQCAEWARQGCQANVQGPETRPGRDQGRREQHHVDQAAAPAVEALAFDEGLDLLQAGSAREPQCVQGGQRACAVSRIGIYRPLQSRRNQAS